MSETGLAEAKDLAAGLHAVSFAAILSSPVDRAQATAQAIAAGRRLRVETLTALDEIDFGEWTGQTFTELDRDPRWRRWNDDRGAACAPNGEAMSDVQARIVGAIGEIAARYAGSAVAIVSHADLIRAALAEYLGLPLGKLLNFDVDPASVSRLVVGGWGGRVVSINETRLDGSIAPAGSDAAAIGVAA